MADWKKIDEHWWGRSLRQFQGTLHGFFVDVRELAPSDRWEITVSASGYTATATTHGDARRARKAASNIARQCSLGLDAARRGEKSRYQPDLTEAEERELHAKEERERAAALAQRT